MGVRQERTFHRPPPMPGVVANVLAGRSNIDRRSRRAPDAGWVLMDRLVLSRKRIAALVRVHPAAFGYTSS